MTTPNQPTDRFRPATDFPKTIEGLPPAESMQLYTEMRDCLIFTNRSRGQLIRRNEEYKQKAIVLKEDLSRLQSSIQQLNIEKIQLSADNQQIISALTQEISTLEKHFDQLASAFEGIEDFESNPQSAMNLVASPGRFFRFLRFVKAIVMWWRSDRPDDFTSPPLPRPPASPLPPSQSAQLSTGNESDARDKPQMGSDQASIGRSLLDK
ncbi:MAG: hypothetical protein F6K28_28150 [Microcoleus sp. SIO2G3]|nr:hypothetical protein [Microcoleus sp. SIO2G3]